MGGTVRLAKALRNDSAVAVVARNQAFGKVRTSRLFRHRQRLAIPESQDSGSQDRCDVDESLLFGRARSYSAVGHVRNLRMRMANARGSGWGRFVAERAASIVYLPGGDPSWRRN